MNKLKLTATWLVLIAIIKKILKYLSLPFLVVFYILKWVYVLIAALITLVIVFIVSIVKGDWKI